MAAVMTHFANGGKVEVANIGVDNWTLAGLPLWEWGSYDYRIAPTPEWVPWTSETCPVGVVVKRKDDAGMFMITGKNKQCCVLAGSNWSYEGVFQYMEQLDGTPCGTEVQTKA